MLEARNWRSRNGVSAALPPDGGLARTVREVVQGRLGLSACPECNMGLEARRSWRMRGFGRGTVGKAVVVGVKD